MNKPSIIQGTAGHKKAIKELKVQREGYSNLPDGRAKSSAFQLSYEESWSKNAKIQEKWKDRGGKEAYIKAAKAWNKKKYGTTEPTAEAKKQNITKKELAKTHAGKTTTTTTTDSDATKLAKERKENYKKATRKKKDIRKETREEKRAARKKFRASKKRIKADAGLDKAHEKYFAKRDKADKIEGVNLDEIKSKKARKEKIKKIKADKRKAIIDARDTKREATKDAKTKKKTTLAERKVAKKRYKTEKMTKSERDAMKSDSPLTKKGGTLTEEVTVKGGKGGKSRAERDYDKKIDKLAKEEMARAGREDYKTAYDKLPKKNKAKYRALAQKRLANQ